MRRSISFILVICLFILSLPSGVLGGETVKDRLWLWAHDAGVYNGDYGLPGNSRITPMEAAAYMGIENVIMVRYDEKPAIPFHQYAVPFRACRRVVWSITGAGGTTSEDERQEVIKLAKGLPNMVGVMMDDFFKIEEGRTLETKSTTAPAALTVDELKGIRERLSLDGRKLDLWVVLYAHQLHKSVRKHLDLCDVITFWTWKSEGLDDLESHFALLEKLAPQKRKVLGCYMWDFGNRSPMAVERMQVQCDLGLRWLSEGRIEGMIFLASPICDLELETVEWTRKWIARKGARAKGGKIV